MDVQAVEQESPRNFLDRLAAEVAIDGEFSKCCLNHNNRALYRVLSSSSVWRHQIGMINAKCGFPLMSLSLGILRQPLPLSLRGAHALT